MTDPVICPHCREHLDIPAEFRGRAVRCANCQNVFPTPSLKSPAEQASDPRDEEPRREDRPRPSRRDEYDRPRRKSNVGVWAALLFVTVALGGVIAGCVGVATWMYNPKMHPFVSAAGKFEVEFPDDPTPAVTGGDKSDEPITVTGRRNQSQERFVVKCYPLPEKLRKLSDDDKLAELVKAELVTEGAGAETRRQTVEHEKFPAVDVMAATPGGVFNRRNTILRCVLVGTKVYVVSAQGPNLEPQVWWVRKYFTSFTVTDVAAKKREAEKGDEPKKQD
jgi:hypothetical protein